MKSLNGPKGKGIKPITQEYKTVKNEISDSQQNFISRLFAVYEKQLDQFLTDAIILLDSDFTILRWNQASERLYEWKRKEAVGRQIGEIIPTQYTSPEQTQGLAGIFENGSWKGEVRHKSKSKKRLYVHSSWFVITNDEGLPQGIIVINRNIMGQKQSQQNLTFANRHLKFHIGNTPLGYIQWDKQLRLETWSPQAEKIFGWKKEEISGKKMYETSLIFKEDLDKFNQAIISVMDHREEQFKLLIRNVTKSGKTLYCEWYNSILRDPNGKMISILSFINDISERILYEKEIKKANKQLKHIFSSVRDCIWCLEKGEDYLEEKYISPSIVTLTGYPASEISRSCTPWMQIVHPDDLSFFKQGCEEVFSGKHTCYEMEYRILHRNGAVRWVSDDLKIRKKGKRLRIYGVSRDVTHKVEYQKKMEESEKKLRRITKYTPGILFQYGRTRQGEESFHIINQEAIELFGINREVTEIFGVSEDVANEDFSKVWEIFPEEEVAIVQEKIKASEENLSRFEHEFYKERGDKAYWYKVISHPELNPEDGSVLWTGIMMDITEQTKIMKDLESRNLELNNFAYKVSHDLRAPLSSVKGLIGLLKKDKDPEALTHYISMMEGSIERLDQFITDVLSHAKVANSKLQAKEIDFEEIINSIFSELSHMPAYDRIEKISELHTKDFYGDENLIKEIFKNLISNGIKYQDMEKEDSYVSISVESDAEKAVIVYKDNGLGIEKDHIPKVFDMFHRASNHSSGSGIGLYIVKQAIEKLEGKIEMESKINEGTTFSIMIPNRAGGQ